MNAVSCHLKEEDSDNLCLFRQERTACAASCRCSSGEDGGAGIIKIVKYGDDDAASAAPREVAVAAIDPLRPKSL
jgi:hypothetical protein